MKPHLINKKIILEELEKDVILINNIKSINFEKNNRFFNFVIILIFILIILFIINRYFEKKIVL